MLIAARLVAASSDRAIDFLKKIKIPHECIWVFPTQIWGYRAFTYLIICMYFYSVQMLLLSGVNACARVCVCSE